MPPSQGMRKQSGSLAQLVEQLTFNQLVAGSTNLSGTNLNMPSMAPKGWRTGVRNNPAQLDETINYVGR